MLESEGGAKSPKEVQLDRKIAEIRRKNEQRTLRAKEVAEDKALAERQSERLAAQLRATHLGGEQTGGAPRRRGIGRGMGGPSQQQQPAPAAASSAAYEQWKAERDAIDRARLARTQTSDGRWRREWDVKKADQEATLEAEDGLWERGRQPPNADEFRNFARRQRDWHDDRCEPGGDDTPSASVGAPPSSPSVGWQVAAESAELAVTVSVGADDEAEDDDEQWEDVDDEEETTADERTATGRLRTESLDRIERDMISTLAANIRHAEAILDADSEGEEAAVADSTELYGTPGPDLADSGDEHFADANDQSLAAL